MRIGDIVKLIQAPSLDWMKEYLSETFEVRDIDSVALTLEMVGSDPEWIWSVSKDNFELADNEE